MNQRARLCCAKNCSESLLGSCATAGNATLILLMDAASPDLKLIFLHSSGLQGSPCLPSRFTARM